MKYLQKFNENVESNDNSVKRSGRLLTQGQREYVYEVEQTEEYTPSILFTDIVNSSEMWNKDSTLMIKRLKHHYETIDRLSKKYNGWIVKSIGDAFMLYFEPNKDTLINTILFAKELVNEEKTYKLRIGAARGAVDRDTYRIQNVDLADFFGNVVNTASRMESKLSGVSGMAFSLHDKEITEEEIDILQSHNILSKKQDKESITIDKLSGAKTEFVYKIENFH